jgi:hypothetical protein
MLVQPCRRGEFSPAPSRNRFLHGWWRTLPHCLALVGLGPRGPGSLGGDADVPGWSGLRARFRYRCR